MIFPPIENLVHKSEGGRFLQTLCRVVFNTRTSQSNNNEPYPVLCKRLLIITFRSQLLLATEGSRRERTLCDGRHGSMGGTRRIVLADSKAVFIHVASALPSTSQFQAPLTQPKGVTLLRP